MSGEGTRQGRNKTFLEPCAHTSKCSAESKRTQAFHPTVGRMAVSHHEKVEVFNVFLFAKEHYFGLVWIHFDPSVPHLRANFL